MKRRLFALLLVLALCLSICACKKADNQEATGITEPTHLAETTETTQKTNITKPTKPTEPAKVTEPTPPTESVPTEPPASNLSVVDWQLEEPAYLSYGEYFSVKRDFTVTWLNENPTEWVKGNRKFTVENKDGLWSVCCEETDEHYYIPQQDGLANYSYMGANGYHGYFKKIDSFIQVNLATGDKKVLLEGQQIRVGIVRDNLVLYYLSTVDGELTLGRCYLPTGQQDTCVKMSGEFYGLGLSAVYSTEDLLVFSMYNPDMIELIRTELANPNSQYKKMWVNQGKDCYDYSDCWEAEDGIAQILMHPLLVNHIQDTSGIRAFMQYTYTQTLGTLTKKTGIIDNCFHGSGYPHDHFNPEITTAEPVEVIMGRKKDLLNQVPEIFSTPSMQGDILLLPDVDSNSYLYVKTDGDYRKIVDIPVSLAVNGGRGAICISADKKSVLAINYEDGKLVEIYRSTGNEITAVDRVFDFSFNREMPWFIIRDGNILVKLDLIENKSQELVRHQYIQPYYYIDSGSTTLYFEICVGLYGTGYTIDMETGELHNRYRL